MWKTVWCFRSAYEFVSSRFAWKVALPVLPKAHAQRFRLAELRFASDSWRFRGAARAPFFLLRWVSQSASVSEKTTCHVWKTVRFQNGINQWHSPAAYDLNHRSVRRKKSFNLCSVVIIMQRYAEPIAELQEIHYSSWISLTQLLHVLSVAIEVDFNLAFQLGRPKPLRKMEPSCLGSI